MNTIKYKSIEIVGATLGSDGRTCGLHIDSCGGAVKVDTKLKLCKSTIQLKVKRTITIDNELEPVTETVELHKKRGRPKKDEQPKTTTIEVDAIEVKHFSIHISITLSSQYAFSCTHATVLGSISLSRFFSMVFPGFAL
jgi:hypothetical protein